MHDNRSTNRGRWINLLILGLAVAPIAFTWFHNRPASEPETSRDWQAPAGGGADGWTLPGQIAVQFRKGVHTDRLQALGMQLGTGLSWSTPFSDNLGAASMTLRPGMNGDQLLAKLRSNPDVEAADYVHVYTLPVELSTSPTSPINNPNEDPARGRWKPNDPRYNEQWNFQMIGAEQAWPVTRGKGVIVAVIDTGVAFSDSRKGQMARDFHDTGFVPGYDFVNNDDTPYDDHGHGTHVAGTIAESTNNGEGVAGIAYESRIMPLKVLSASGSGRSDSIASAIRWAADHGANVINMSLGSPIPDSMMRSACDYARGKGVVIVCAAGNSGREGVGYPAAYPSCIAVSAVGPDRELSFYSTWGKQLAIAAPGGDKMKDPDHGGILQNTVMRDENGITDDYFAFQGTSMASPHVAATAALVMSLGVRDPGDVKAILQRSASKAPGPANKYGAGILDAGAAVALAGKTHGDGVARFWMVALLYAGCWGIGRLRKRSGSTLGAPFWATTALAFGMIFPDWISGYFGMTASANLIGHSILLPGLLILGLSSKERTERHLIAMLTLGLLFHLGWEFLRGTAPFGPEIGTMQLIPWIIGNLIVGVRLLADGWSRQDA